MGNSPAVAKKRSDASVKIDMALYRKAKHIAAHRDITIAEYLSALLEGPVSRDYEKFKKEIAGEDKAGDRGKTD